MVRNAFRIGGGAGGWSAASRGRSSRSSCSLVQTIANRSPSLVKSVAVLAGDSIDEPVEAQRGQVVAGLVGGVVDAVEQCGHQGAQALVGPSMLKPFGRKPI